MPFPSLLASLPRQASLRWAVHPRAWPDKEKAWRGALLGQASVVETALAQDIRGSGLESKLSCLPDSVFLPENGNMYPYLAILLGQ